MDIYRNITCYVSYLYMKKFEINAGLWVFFNNKNYSVVHCLKKKSHGIAARLSLSSAFYFAHQNGFFNTGN